MEDPLAKVQYRTSGARPYLTHLSPLPVEIVPRQTTLRDRVTFATLFPFSAPHQVPPALLSVVCQLLNDEIEAGDTYPMIEPMPADEFATYWFANFAAVVILGDRHTADELLHGPLSTSRETWEKHCLGSFYIKPNYPGRSSHVCSGGFLVASLARNRGVGRLMGEGYLEWAPKLGYSYSVFNLVYETNVASCKIWDSLGFKRIGRVKGCGNLKSFPDRLVDALQYGRDLGPEGEEYASDDRFDKIRYYLKQGKYPEGSDRAEKSRLRSAATHYRLVHGIKGQEEKLMLKDKEVVSDPIRQHEIARHAHQSHHAGINKTTAAIAEKYHWIGIKTSVSVVIRTCPECRDAPKSHHPKGEGYNSRAGSRKTSNAGINGKVAHSSDDSDDAMHQSADHFPASFFQKSDLSQIEGDSYDFDLDLEGEELGSDQFAANVTLQDLELANDADFLVDEKQFDSQEQFRE